VPSLSEFLTTFSWDTVGAAFIVIFGAGYLHLVAKLRYRGHKWPVTRTLVFVILGLGVFAWVQFGFFGTYRYELRWAFTTRIALLLFGVPMLLGLGRPLELARAALGTTGKKRLNAFMASWPVRLVSNAIFAPLFALTLFMFFITPTGGAWRESALAQDLSTVLSVVFGMLMLLPINSKRHHRSEIFIVAEFIFAFAELMLDAIPGVVLSISNVVLDHAHSVAGAFPAWFPSALNDQHFSGNLLWMIAEAADIPILVMLFIRWGKSDRKTAKAVDDLTDEEFEALANQHLKGPRR
jgi:cytochrome c oxidase assembly factor CtaG